MERFPPINDARLAASVVTSSKAKENDRPRRRRTSSGLPGEPRGDTGAAALSTLSDKFPPRDSDSLTRTPSDKALPRSKRRKAKTLLRRFGSACKRHTWLGPLLICLTILSAYAYNPNPSNPLHGAIFISYAVTPAPGTDPSIPIQYGKGGLDFAFVGFYIVVLSFTREFLMQRLIRPLAIYLKVKSRAKQARFMEQVYSAVYFGIFGLFGLWIMSRSPIWYFNTKAMYEGFPHKTHEAYFKTYYLLQASYWAQQAIVLLLQLEKPRKDFKELVGHHIITLALIWCSYRFHFTYMGIAVYITHDLSDFFLATSKTLNYIDSSFTGPYFGMFIFIWAYLRHYLNLRILLSVLTEFSTVGPFELNWDTQQYKCRLSQTITFGLLLSLQMLNIFWFWLILRIAKNYVILRVEPSDVRSDAGSDDELDDTDTDAGPPASTAEKRARLAAVPGAVVPNGPEVLLNGKPIADLAANGNGSVPVRQVEVQVRERRAKR